MDQADGVELLPDQDGERRRNDRHDVYVPHPGLAQGAHDVPDLDREPSGPGPRIEGTRRLQSQRRAADMTCGAEPSCELPSVPASIADNAQLKDRDSPISGRVERLHLERRPTR